MKEKFKIVVVLTLVCILSGAGLSVCFKKLYPKIKENQKELIRKALRLLVEEGSIFKERKIGNQILYEIYSPENTLLGYALISEGNGYQGKIKILVALKKDLKTLWGIEIIQSSETPGLGARITEKDFKEQFKNLVSVPQIKLTKTKKSMHNEIEAISGATISSQAVVKIVNKGIKKIKSLIGDES